MTKNLMLVLLALVSLAATAREFQPMVGEVFQDMTSPTGHLIKVVGIRPARPTSIIEFSDGSSTRVDDFAASRPSSLEREDIRDLYLVLNSVEASDTESPIVVHRISARLINWETQQIVGVELANGRLVSYREMKNSRMVPSQALAELRRHKWMDRTLRAEEYCSDRLLSN